MATLVQISIIFSASTIIIPNELRKKPINCCPFPIRNNCSFDLRSFKLRVYEESLKGRLFKGVILAEENGWQRKKRVVVVGSNQGFGFNNGGGGGGGGGDDGGTARIVGNLALAIGLTYLSFTGQLGWILDAIVSIWLFLIIVPIVGLGAFLWWASRDIVQGRCMNCGNDFQIFKSLMNDESQLCPYCNKPFSVVENEFVSDPMKSANQSTTFGQAFDDLFTRSKKENKISKAIVDIEAEVKDVD